MGDMEGVVLVAVAALAGAVIGVNLTFLYCRRSLVQLEQRYRDLQSTLAKSSGGGLMSKEQWEARKQERDKVVAGLLNTNQHSPSPPQMTSGKK